MPPPRQDPAAAFAVDAGQGERLTFGMATVLVKATEETTGGAFSMWEELAPMLDTPLHVHEHEDELFHILDGEHIVICGEEEFELGPGGLIFLPRGVPHAHRRVVPGAGRLLAIASPSGFDGFFRMLADADGEGSLGPDAYAAASERYGVTWLDGG